MKKLLIAICGAFLLAALIQMVTDTTSNTSKETSVKPISIEQASEYLTNNNRLMSTILTANNSDLESLIKQGQNEVEDKTASTKPTTHTQTEDKETPTKPTASTQKQNKVTATKSTTPTQTENKVTETKPTQPSQTEDKVTETKPTAPPQTEDKVPPTQQTPPTTIPDKETPTKPTTTPSDVNAFEQQVVELTNTERTKAGLAPLQTDAKLMAAAREKSQDMQTNNYFSHTSPTFGSPFDRLNALGISYKAAGENIAQGQRTPQEVVQGWMNSSGHRANILNANFTHIGVGYVKTGNYWTQQFIQK